MTEETKPTPIVSPIAALLRSRKTIVALATALANVLVLAVPTLEPVRTELVTILTVLGTVLIASIAAEDSAEKSSPTVINAPSAGDTNVNAPPPDEGDARPLAPMRQEHYHD